MTASMFGVAYRKDAPKDATDGVFVLCATGLMAAAIAQETTRDNVHAACEGIVASASERGLLLDYTAVYVQRHEQLAEAYGVKVVELSKEQVMGLIEKHFQGLEADSERGSRSDQGDGLPGLVDP